MNPKRTYQDEEPSASLPKRPRAFDNTFNGGIHLNHDAYSPRVHGDYTIAWICALPLELAASRAMLDEEHLLPPNQAGDDNIYVLGRIDQHNVVMTCLPGQYGTNNAAIVATNLKRSFPSIRATLMVGIGGGSPSQTDLYLGDVVVGTRVIQYDMGKVTVGGLFQGTADAKTPAWLLNSAVSALRSKHGPHHSSSRMASILRSRLPYILRPNHPDHLFQASYEHPFGEPTCIDCDPEKLQPRGERLFNEPRIHYGVIASGNRVMKDGKARNAIAQRLSALCFEMEAAGMMDNLQCLPIRGICDYSDSHKNKEWQDYAAATAAAYARELLEGLPPSSRTLDRTPTYITNASQGETAGNANHCQLNAPIHQSISIPDALSHIQAAQRKGDLNLKFPFLEYSVFNVLHHANSAQQHSMEQDGFLTVFPLPCWITLNNTLESYAIRRYSRSVNIFYILAEKNLADLIRIHSQKASEYCFDVGGERYGPPFFAALATGSHQAAQAMLNILQARAQLSDYPLRDRDLWAQHCEKAAERTEFGRGFTFSRRKGVLSYLQKPGDEAIFLAYLFSGQVEVNAADNSGRTPLSWAAMRGHDAAVQLLLKVGAEVDAKDHSGRTPLSWAAEKGHKTAAQLLHQAGAEVHAKDNWGRTPLLCAAKAGREALVRQLLEAGAKVDAKDNVGWRPLSWAADSGHKAVVSLLLEAGAEVDSEGYDGGKPLLRAVMEGNKTIVQQLLENGANVDLKDLNGQTPLSWSATRGHGPVVELLLKNGADVNSRDTKLGWTPLSWSVGMGHGPVVELLLKNGADVDSKDNNTGRTPLSWAAETGHEAITRLLLEAGADINMKDNSGRTPQSYVPDAIDGDYVLEDYQRQLMLLELQNPKRQMMDVEDRPQRHGSTRFPIKAHEREAMIKLLAPDLISRQHDRLDCE